MIPVLNEAAALPGLLSAMPGGYRPIVVDNGSTDGSGPIACELGARVVTEPARGFGAACWAGLLAADAGDGVVCFMDGDGSLDPSDLPLWPSRCWPATPTWSSAPAARSDGEHGRCMPGLGNAAIAAELRRRTGHRLRDLGPMRAAPAERLRRLGIQDRRFGWPLEMVLLAADAGWRVAEVPVSYAPRTGRSKVTGTVRGTLRTVQDMSRVLR